MDPVAVSAKRKLTTDDQIPHPRKYLRIEIPSTVPTSTSSATTTSSPSSLFSAAPHFHDDLDTSASPTTTTSKPALRIAPPIPGLYFDSTLELPSDLSDSVISFCMSTYFRNPDINQIMLFTRFSSQSTTSSLPPVLLDLLDTVSGLLRSHIPDETHELLFPETPTQARQVIINLYTPGEGISPHVDLLKRFGDGIIGVSLGSGCVMRFAKASGSEGGDGGPARTSILDGDEPRSSAGEKAVAEGHLYDLYLPERSVLVLSADARYKWTHEIEKRKSDLVSHPCTTTPSSTRDSKCRWLDRGVRLSVTFRWLLPGADVVGCDEESDS